METFKNWVGKNPITFGGIVALLPNQYSIAVWSPKLNNKGNSYRGMKFLEEFTAQTHTSIF